MKILIVSFDKNMVSKIREVLSEHDLTDVKNGEEAVNTVSDHMDVIIYDAVSGSISEEDINDMYIKKFKNSKYIILVDDLFPVDMNNIMPPRKIKVMRDEVATKIKDAILSEPEVVAREYSQDTPSGEKLYMEDIPASQSTYTEEMLGLREFDFGLPTEPTLSELPTEPTLSQIEDLFQGGFVEEPLTAGSGLFQEESIFQESMMQNPLTTQSGLNQREGMFEERTIQKPLKKLLLVSFDATLINNVREAVSRRVEVLEARNIKDALEKAKESDIIFFDTISGMLAYRTLTDMSKNVSLAKKPYVLLIDELFTIDVGNIPLERKYTFAREAELSKAIEKVLELAEEPSAGYSAEPSIETYSFEVPSPAEPKPVTFQEEDKGIMGLLEEIIVSGVEKQESQNLVEKVPLEIEKREMPPTSEGMIRMENIPVSESMIHIGNISEILTTTIKDAIKEQLSKEKVLSLLSNLLSPEEMNRQVASLLERRLEEIIREKINEVFSRIDITQIVREEAYKVLKERLNELIT